MTALRGAKPHRRHPNQEVYEMRYRSTPIIAAALLFCLLPVASQAQLSAYSQDFESMDPLGSTALADDGWTVFASVFDATGLPPALYGYGPFTAPNDPSNPAFCNLDTGQGGIDQGFVQLVTLSDYNNSDHANGFRIETNVFQEQIITADHIGQTWRFFFEAKLGNLAGASTAAGFIKTIENFPPFNQTNNIQVDMTTTPVSWTGYEISITLTDAALEGQLLQFGFVTTASNFESSAVFYDNIVFEQVTGTSTPEAGRQLALAQNYPNPFNPSTTISFDLPQAGHAELSVYDVAGRRVATIHSGSLGAGNHDVTWNGRNDDGFTVASGQYRYVLRTPQGQVSRGMTLLK